MFDTMTPGELRQMIALAALVGFAAVCTTLTGLLFWRQWKERRFRQLMDQINGPDKRTPAREPREVDNMRYLIAIFSIVATFAIILNAIMDRGPVRVVPFDGKNAYILELGDGYIRVHHDGGPVLDDGGTPYELATPWNANDLSEVKIIKDDGAIRLEHPDYPPYRLTHNSASPADWTLQPVEVIP